ncbi:hypothetical protein DFJ73DRAFT_863913 [Zopfochytrium polystomum]|nr:hypothetical protein DFJ73DRAFT_863913 [Zopfochytrium polystomum]
MDLKQSLVHPPPYDDGDRDDKGQGPSNASPLSPPQPSFPPASSSASAPPRTELTGPPKIIVIAVDGQDHSRTAFKWAFNNLIRPSVDKVFLVNVQFTNGGFFGGFGMAPEEEYQKKLLKSFCDLVDPKVIRMTVLAEHGLVDKIVATVTNKENADFVVIGRNEHKGVKLHVGSMSAYLKRHCKKAQVIRVSSLDDPLVIEEIDKPKRTSFLGMFG